MTTATALVSVIVWTDDALLARIGAGATVASTLQFGWFLDHGFAAFAALGTLLQAGWFIAVGARYRPGNNPTRGRPHEQR
jgi:hypothetical protein